MPLSPELGFSASSSKSSASRSNLSKDEAREVAALRMHRGMSRGEIVAQAGTEHSSQYKLRRRQAHGSNSERSQTCRNSLPSTRTSTQETKQVMTVSRDIAQEPQR